MRTAIVLAVLAVLCALSLPSTTDAAARCQFGRVQGFATIRYNPPYVAGQIPGEFTDRARFFARRYNCKRQGALVRRLDLGVYDVMFPGLPRRTPFATAVSHESVSVSVVPLRGAIYRVVLRGPLLDEDVLARRDVPFSIAVY